MFGLAFGRGIVRDGAFELIFGRVEFEWRVMNFGWKSGEFHFAIGVGPGLQVEVMKSAEAVRDMDFDGGVVNRFLVSA